MPVVSYYVGFLSGLLTPFATLRSLLEAGGSTSKTLRPALRALARILLKQFVNPVAFSISD